MVLIPIPYAMSYTTTMTGRTPKGVQCEECDFKFVYLIEETVQATATSMLFLDNEGAEAQSAAGAASQLNAALRHKLGVVPCPACGHVQTHMIPTARTQYHLWAAIVGKVATIAGIVAVLAAALYSALDSASRHIATLTWIMWGVAVALLAIGPTLMIGRFIKASQYDPNAEPVERRIADGRNLAVSFEEFLQIQGGSPAPPSPVNPSLRSTDIKAAN